jgi:hypothetical protein
MAMKKWAPRVLRVAESIERAVVSVHVIHVPTEYQRPVDLP